MLVFSQGLIFVYYMAFTGLGVLSCVLLEMGQVSINDCPSPMDEWWLLKRFQASGHGWERLRAPERQRWEGTEASASCQQGSGDTTELAKGHHLSQAFISPTSTSHLPGLLIPKPGAESKSLPSALTAGNEDQREGRGDTLCILAPFSSRSAPEATRGALRLP